MNKPFDVPILLLIFKREESALKVVDEIRKQQPKYLYIAADGPREGNDDDIEKCKKTRQAVINAIDWDCNVKTYFRDQNRGCGYAPAEAITWFFESVEMGIILEDDIIPSQSFFPFCEELLEKYKDNEQIMSIAGTNLISKDYPSEASYHFSNYAGNWGWATWRRAWKLYDYNISDWNNPEVKEKIRKKFSNENFLIWEEAFDLVCDKNIDHIWDYQWLFTKFLHCGFGIIPSKNLTTNIGFNSVDATHTSGIDSNLLDANVQEEISLPLIHPNETLINKDFDATLAKKFYSKNIESTASKLTTKENRSFSSYLISILQRIIAKIFNSRLFLNNPHLKLSEYIIHAIAKKNIKQQHLVTKGDGTVFYPEAIVYNPPNDPSKIIVGKNSHIQGELHIFNYGGKIEIGDNTYVGKDSRIWSGNSVKIGNNVLISHFCNIIDTNSHEINPYERADRSREIFTSGHWKEQGSIKTAPIIIKDYVWVSFNVTILKGVTIGEGAIVGAGSFVTKDVPDWALVVGNPARVVKIIPIEERLKNYKQ